MSSNDGGQTHLHRAAPATLEWCGGITGRLRLIDQTRLPVECTHVDCATVENVWEAIRALRVRGAPAIGVAAAYGVVLGLQTAVDAVQPDFDRRFAEVSAYLKTSRPTAVNLSWAVERMGLCIERNTGEAPQNMLEQLLDEARAIEHEDREMCEAIGKHGAGLLAGVRGVATHCNAGGLATAGDGTALAVIFAAAAQGGEFQVYVDETRPLLQGARLTMWELMRRGIPCTLICDSAAAWVMKKQRVEAVITGADRIAANGDAANKIGTYSLALAARAHEIPFYIAAPSSTFDLSIPTGADIPIEQRGADEITRGFGPPTAPEGAMAYNPAFDVTPAEYIAAIVTERGVIRPVNAASITEVLGR